MFNKLHVGGTECDFDDTGLTLQEVFTKVSAPSLEVCINLLRTYFAATNNRIITTGVKVTLEKVDNERKYVILHKDMSSSNIETSKVKSMIHVASRRQE